MSTPPEPAARGPVSWRGGSLLGRARVAARARRSSLAFVVLVLVPVAVLAAALHRRGISWGDDFALYVRQARSLGDGNVGQVIADNRVNVELAAKPGFSPYVYPWGFPLLLAPFVRWWWPDVERLRLVEVACWCGFLGFWFGVLRRRMAAWLALVTVAASGYSIAYLRHTGSILSELPFMALLAGTIWYVDRITGRSDQPDQPDQPVVSWAAIERGRLIVLGLLMMLLFNTRREGLAVVPAVLALQVLECRGSRSIVARWRQLVLPHATFLVSVVAFQLVLPSALAPAYAGSGLGQTWRKLRTTFQASFVDQLGFHPLGAASRLAIGVVVVIGIIVRLRRHARADLGLLVYAAVSLVIVGMIPADADRYTMAITPFAVYFGVQALAAVPRSKAVLGGAAAVLLLGANLVDLPAAVRQTNDANRDGSVQTGPDEATSREMFAAVRAHTHYDDIVGFFKGRALTLYTDRRAVQSKDLSLILQRADYFVMGRTAGVGIPNLTDAQAATAGLEEVWSNSAWVLYRVPQTGS